MQRLACRGCRHKKRAMRKWIIFLMVLSACHKTQSNSEPGTTPGDGISGSWELSSETGGIAGVVNYASGNGNTISFFKSGTFRQISAPSLASLTGTYQIIKTGAPDGKDLLVRKYDSPVQTTTDSIIISNDQLILSRPPQCCDIPYSWTYNRTLDKY
jgi:hypothetical protein